MGHLNFTLSGTGLVLMETAVKGRTDGRTYHCFRKPNQGSGFSGVQIPALAKTLPTSITIDGVKIDLVVGKSPASYEQRDGTTKIVPEEDRRPQSTGTRVVTLPSLGEERNVSVKVTLRADGEWNVKITVNRAGGASSVSPEERAAKAKVTSKNNLDLIRALMATA